MFRFRAEANARKFPIVVLSSLDPRNDNETRPTRDLNKPTHFVWELL